MWFKVEGLNELVKEAEKIASQQEISKTNKKILKKSAEKIQTVLKPKVHKSKNVNASGLKGKKTGIHASDSIKIGRPKNKGGYEFIEIGWDYKEPHGYMQWEEWGNTTREPHPVLYPTIEASKDTINKVSIDEYQELIKRLK